MKTLPEGERRRRATLATKERYENKTFDWSRGVTCVHLARFHLRQMGHKVPTIPRFRSAHGARQAMKVRGWASVGEMLDGVLPGARISPASMVLGDLCAVDGEGGMQAVFVCAGPRRVFGWVEGNDAPVMVEPDMDKIVGAWRV